MSADRPPEPPDQDRPSAQEASGGTPAHRRRLSMFGYSLTLPESRILRMSLGAALCFGGLFAFLPVLGLWMIPLGLAVLSVDVPPIRRHSSRAAVHLRRRYPELVRRIFPKDR